MIPILSSPGINLKCCTNNYNQYSKSLIISKEVDISYLQINTRISSLSHVDIKHKIVYCPVGSLTRFLIEVYKEMTS